MLVPLPRLRKKLGPIENENFEPKIRLTVGLDRVNG